jgi:hypothetical protein
VLGLLTECASGSDRALQANDGEAVIRAFEQIGREISQVRGAGLSLAATAAAVGKADGKDHAERAASRMDQLRPEALW